jgi:hypothetical protein
MIWSENRQPRFGIMPCFNLNTRNIAVARARDISNDTAAVA